MKTFLKKMFVLSIIMLFSSILKAQYMSVVNSDYVITAKGDSIFCDVSKPFIGKYSYRQFDDRKSKKILPAEIKEFYLGEKNETYRPVYTPGSNRPEFLEVLEKGAIKLYVKEVITYSYGGASSSTTVWYVSKGSDTVNELKTSSLFLPKSRKERKNELAEMLIDKKDVYNKYISDDKFNFDQIRSIIHFYNTGEWIEDFSK